MDLSYRDTVSFSSSKTAVDELQTEKNYKQQEEYVPEAESQNFRLMKYRTLLSSSLTQARPLHSRTMRQEISVDKLKRRSYGTTRGKIECLWSDICLVLTTPGATQHQSNERARTLGPMQCSFGLSDAKPLGSFRLKI